MSVQNRSSLWILLALCLCIPSLQAQPPSSSDTLEGPEGPEGLGGLDARLSELRRSDVEGPVGVLSQAARAIEEARARGPHTAAGLRAQDIASLSLELAERIRLRDGARLEVQTLRTERVRVARRAEVAQQALENLRAHLEAQATTNDHQALRE